VVVGVHSGKYIAERETPRIREASLRLGISHPIVNDRQFRIWRAYAVRAWPTLTIIDRNGYVVGAHAGEFTAEMLYPLLEALVSMSATTGSGNAPVRYAPDTPAIKPSRLCYPQKVAVDKDRVAVSDTGNHRVLIGRLESTSRMTVEHEITGLERGNSTTDTLKSPQGLGFEENKLYVSDSETHTVCVVDLQSGKARVLAGTGDQMRTRSDRESGALSSPWDVAIVGNTLYVAMAGVHQIWAIDRESGAARVHSGTGGEDIIDGSNSNALLAQPMGVVSDGRKLYFVDAESSAVRWADIEPEGNVGTIVGTGLFDFGDVDGTGESVRMQHQQGIELYEGELLVADSYNNAIKRVDIKTRTARTFVRGLNEPGGIATGDRHLYVADTNAHRIVTVDYATQELAELEISD
jgi:DNA-binding beta-propeller fold protein YncE